MAQVTMPDGNNINIPDFALDSTALKILAELQKQTKGVEKQLSQLVDYAKDSAKRDEKEYKDSNKSRKEAEKNADEAAKNAKLIADNIKNNESKTNGAGVKVDTAGLDRFNKGAALGEKAFVKFYDGAVSTAKMLGATAILVGGTIIDNFMGLGQTLNDMTKAGVGFGDGIATGGMSATESIKSLSSMGLNASETMMRFSNVVQTMGKQAFTSMTQTFLDATESGADLGMSMQDSADRLGREMEKRRLMGVLDAVNQAQMTKQITTSIKRQQAYANAVGESTDNLVAFSESLLERTPALTASLMRLDGDLRSKVIGGITDFGTAMRALGGEEGGQIAAAFTEAAASGAMGFSDGMTGYVTALPSLAGPMNKYISAIQSGTLTQDDANEMAQDLARQLGNVSQSEKNRIFALARAGDAQAESMAKAIAQFEQTEKQIKKINAGYTMEGVQRGTNVITNIFKEFTGTFEALKTSFLVGLGEAGGAGETIADAFIAAKTAIMPAINELAKAFGFGETAFESLDKAGEGLGQSLGKNLVPMIKSAGENLAIWIKSLAEWIGQFNGEDGKFDFGLMIQGIKDSLLSGIKSIVWDIGKYLMLGVAGLLAVKVVGNLIVKGLTKPLDEVGKATSSVISRLTKAVGNAMGNIGTGIKNLASGIGNALSSVATGVSNGLKALGDGIAAAGKGIGEGVGNLLKGLMTGVASGLKALGDPKAALGAVVLAGLAATMWISAKAFQAFADVTWPSIAKGFVALLGLGAVAAVLGLALPLIVPGAAAIGALGLALIPFAAAATLAAPAMDDIVYSLVRLKDVDITTLLGIGPAMLGLAAGMSALSAGGLISNVLDGLGSLFGGDSPVEKLMQLGQAAPAINALSENMKGFGDNVSAFNDAMSQIRGDAFAGEFNKITSALEMLNEQMDEVSIGKIMKMSALKMFGGPSETERYANREAATDALRGGFGDNGGGLEDLYNQIKTNENGTMDAVIELRNQLTRYGIKIDEDALMAFRAGRNSGASGEQLSALASTSNQETQSVIAQLGALIDSYRKQEITGVEQRLSIATPTVATTLEQNNRTPAPAIVRDTPTRALPRREPTTRTAIAVPNNRQIGAVNIPENLQNMNQNDMFGEAQLQAAERGMAGSPVAITSLFEQMVREQAKTNRLLQKGNRYSEDIADNI